MAAKITDNVAVPVVPNNPIQYVMSELIKPQHTDDTTISQLADVFTKRPLLQY